MELVTMLNDDDDDFDAHTSNVIAKDMNYLMFQNL